MSSINGFGGDSRTMNGLTTFTGDTIDCNTLNAIRVNADEIYLDGDLLVYPQSVSFNAPFTVTGNAGTNASISDVITTANNLQTHQLTFTIPRGDPGDTTEAEEIANDALAAAEAAEDLAAAADVAAAAAVVTAGTALGVATGAATTAGIALSTANAAQSDADTALSRTQYTRTTNSNYTVFTGDNRNQDPTFPEVYYQGGEGIRFYNKVITIDPFPTSFLQLRLTIGNNGDITQEGGTTTLNDLVVKLTTDETNSQFCIPYTRDITISDNTPRNTRLGVDASFNFNPFTNTLSVPFITSDLSGTASKVLAASSVLNSDLPIPFLSNSTGSVDILTDIVNGITYNPSTNNLTCTTLTGTATNINVSEVATNGSFRVPFLGVNTGSAALGSDAGLLYNPSNNLLTTTVSNINVEEVETNSSFRVPFLAVNTGSSSLGSDGGLTYNPSTDILSCNVSGNLTGNVLGSTINIGDPTATDEINIEGRNNCNINIGIASFLNNVNIGNATSSVNIRCITDTAVTVFNPFDQMNGVF